MDILDIGSVESNRRRNDSVMADGASQVIPGRDQDATNWRRLGVCWLVFRKIMLRK